ncbi:MAG: hypothetical protein ACE5HS_07675 [bacterium]
MLQKKQVEFQIRFIWWALGVAIFAGFALGAHVASVIGLDFPLSRGYHAFVQTHGHLQLVGWAGLFILGVSLHFIPRLAGVPIARPKRIDLVLYFITAGLSIRFLSHSILPYLTDSFLVSSVQILILLSTILELIGIILYFVLIVETILKVHNFSQRAALLSVRPFFAMMLSGWFLYGLLMVILGWNLVFQNKTVMDPEWNEFGLQMFITLVLLPVAFAFSVRMFPLYLRLPVVDWSVKKLALVYFAAVCSQILPTLPPILSMDASWPLYLSNAGRLLKSAAILWFIWKIDVLTRWREPWTIQRLLHPGVNRRPTREGMPDYGEFGYFEYLIYAAYSWLLFGAVVEIIVGFSVFTNWNAAISTDAVRHIYLLGFITHLILGMSVRMIPGFIKKKKVARPGLVMATFWLASLAVVSRIVPLLLPSELFKLLPGTVVVMQTAFGFSGLFGMAAIVCLAINLIKTAEQVNQVT